MTLVTGIILIIAQIVIGILFGAMVVENKRMRNMLEDEPDEPVHWYLFYDRAFETAMEVVQGSINTYESKGYRVTKSRQKEGSMWFKFDVGHELTAIDVTEEWDIKLPKNVRNYIVMDSSIDGELIKGIMEKIGATNALVKFLLFNEEGED